MQHYVLYNKRMIFLSPFSSVIGALGPINIATAPAPPVGRALPEAYTAISAATTRANRPSNIVTYHYHNTVLITCTCTNIAHYYDQEVNNYKYVF